MADGNAARHADLRAGTRRPRVGRARSPPRRRGPPRCRAPRRRRPACRSAASGPRRSAVSPRRARSLVTALIAHGREAGTPAAAAARALVAGFLSELGYTVQEQPFTLQRRHLSRAAGRRARCSSSLSLRRDPAAAAAGPRLGCRWRPCWCSPARRRSRTSLVLGRRSGAPRQPARRTPTSSRARRGAVVRCWLVAHLDTKAQGHSMAGRLVALWVTARRRSLACIVWPCLRLGGPLPAGCGVAAGALGVLAGLLLAGGRLAGQSPGARDNGSGLARGADGGRSSPPTPASASSSPGRGIRAGRRPGAGRGSSATLFEGAEVLNVDTIDDEGTLFVVTHGRADVLGRRVRDRARRPGPGPGATAAAGDHGGRRAAGPGGRRRPSPSAGCPGAPCGACTPPGMMPPATPLATAELLGERLAAPI